MIQYVLLLRRRTISSPTAVPIASNDVCKRVDEELMPFENAEDVLEGDYGATRETAALVCKRTRSGSWNCSPFVLENLKIGNFNMLPPGNVCTFLFVLDVFHRSF